MILVINTSGGGIELAIGDRVTNVSATRQAAALPAAVDKFMHECDTTWNDIHAVAVVTGPGSFTGIRLGIAYAKGIGIGRNIPVVGVSAFELYLGATPDAFVAIESGRGDFFVAAHDLPPQTMDIDEIETRQMAYPRTVGHRPFDIKLATHIAEQKIADGTITPVVPMYLRKSYAEEQKG